ncbi:MAG TPA: TMEM175 family protein [Terracidiphilus sp.]|jgi:uncharacterized membrane protein|nr:TMEM175 family protein [Terracidiphilus sp.]
MALDALAATRAIAAHITLKGRFSSAPDFGGRRQVPTLYNRIQGRNLERLAALSDGIFAVAMTLLVLDLHIPTAAQVHNEGELLGALCAMGPQWLTYGMSFLTLGIFWAGQQTQLNQLGEGSRDLTWIHLGFLFSITLMPLSTRLLAEFIAYRLALGIYWLNIFVPGAMLYWSWAYATRANLIKSDTPDEVRGSICRRILIAQSLYAAGAALCFFSNWISIAVIVLVQLNYAIAPRLTRARG